MAGVTVSRPDLFPDGTTVNAYLRSAQPQSQTPQSGVPAGSSAGSAVAANGQVTISGLADSTQYILYAGSPDRYLGVSTQATARPVGELRRTAVIPAVAIDETLPRQVVSASTNTGVSGRLTLMGVVMCPAGRTISNLSVMMGTTQAVAPTNQWMTLVRCSDRVILGKTVDDLTTAWAASALKTLALATPYTPAADELAWVGLLVVASTMPTMSGFSGLSALLGVAPLIAGLGVGAGFTTPASLTSPIAAPSGTGPQGYAYIS